MAIASFSELAVIDGRDGNVPIRRQYPVANVTVDAGVDPIRWAHHMRHLCLIQRYPVDSAISAEFIDLMEGFALSHGLSIPDALIAATALVHKVELYTLNTKDFRFIPGIQLYSPKTY